MRRVLLAFAALALAVPALAALTFPPLTGRVVDEAHLLSADRKAAIEAKLAALEKQTSDQFVVATVNSLQGTDIADYGYQLGRFWGIGQKDRNNGVLLLVAPNERKVRIEVGYGLEGDLTDAVSRLIIENSITPRFRAGDMPGGIERGVDDILQVLGGGADDFKARAAAQAAPASPPESIPNFIFVIIVIFIVISILRSRGRRRRGLLWPTVIGSSSSWGSSGSSSGGGFSGGGGSFGGGGSSGSW